MGSPLTPPFNLGDDPQPGFGRSVRLLLDWYWQRVGKLVDDLHRDRRFSDDRVAYGIRNMSGIVQIEGPNPPAANYCLVSTSPLRAVWVECPGGSGGGGSSFLHNLLSATHPDTVAASPVRGDTVVGNSTPAWTKLAIGASGKFYRSNGADPSWQLIVETDIVDGAILARVAANETITGAWLFTTAPQFGDAGTVGQIKFGDGNTAFLVTFTTSLLSANQTVTIPDATGTITLGVGNPINRTNQSADVATAALLSSGHPAGNYMVSVSLADTTADLTAGAVTATIGWTDDSGARTDTVGPQVLTGLGSSNKLFPLYSTGAASITYAISHTGIFGTSKYAARIRTEHLS